ncbi:MAG: permease-like cell division protein FtsX, partial [Bacteroidota bacterium]
ARVRQRLADLPGADSLRFVSRAEATETFREAFGEGADLFDEDALMPASFKVRFRGAFASPDSLDRAVARVKTWNQVEDVGYDPDLLQAIERNRKAIQQVGLGAGLLVVFAALLLVGNTIRLSIYARRMLIRTMKLVGATGSFIRRPFLVEGGIQGLVAGAVAGALLWGVWSLLLRQLREADIVVGWPGGTPLAALALCLVVGLALGLLASWVAVRRFIREVRLSA